MACTSSPWVKLRLDTIILGFDTVIYWLHALAKWNFPRIIVFSEKSLQPQVLAVWSPNYPCKLQFHKLFVDHAFWISLIAILVKLDKSPFFFTFLTSENFRRPNFWRILSDNFLPDTDILGTGVFPIPPLRITHVEKGPFVEPGETRILELDSSWLLACLRSQFPLGSALLL